MCSGEVRPTSIGLLPAGFLVRIYRGREISLVLEVAITILDTRRAVLYLLILALVARVAVTLHHSLLVVVDHELALAEGGIGFGRGLRI